MKRNGDPGNGNLEIFDCQSAAERGRDDFCVSGGARKVSTNSGSPPESVG
jgi:hypothetical protein